MGPSAPFWYFASETQDSDRHPLWRPATQKQISKPYQTEIFIHVETVKINLNTGRVPKILSHLKLQLYAIAVNPKISHFPP